MSDAKSLTPFWGARKKFIDPFLKQSTLSIPENWTELLDFVTHLSIADPLYTEVIKRTVAHFITDIEFVDKTGDKDERDRFKDILVQGLDIHNVALRAGMEFFLYGNSFLFVYTPFTRSLVDRRDGSYREYPISDFPESLVSFNLSTLTYSVPDPVSVREGTSVYLAPKVNLEFIDRRSKDADRIKIMNLNPRYMQLNRNPISGAREYIYRFEEFFVADVKAGNRLYQINTTPRAMLDAISKGQDFKFAPDQIFHFCHEFITGLSHNGWGIPKPVLNYQAIHQGQVYNCINEAVGLDYLTPLRLITPTPSAAGAGGDTAMSVNLSMFVPTMKQFINVKRQDPTAMFAAPFPVNYQELGGNGKALAPVDLLQYQTEQTLNAAGFPANLYNLNLQMQVIPTAIRQFESTHGPLYHSLNSFYQWVAKKVLNILGKPLMGVRLVRPSVADDLERRHVLLNLAGGGEISRSTAYKPWGVSDPVAEKEKRVREDMDIEKKVAELNAEFQKSMETGSMDQIHGMQQAALQEQQAAAAGGMPGSGGAAHMPPPAAGGDTTPLDVLSQGQQMAQQWLSMPEGDRRKAMRDVEATNPNLYAVAKQAMEEMRAQGASQGRKMVEQQMQQG